MPKTWFSIGLGEPAESSRTVRSLRADPPEQIRAVLDGDKNRRTTFQMSLEQAQQQFRAASAIGYESRPLNLYYGIAQAGRALAAASATLGSHHKSMAQHVWQASGHGITFAPDADAKLGVFGNPMRVKPAGDRDLYSRVATALGFPTESSAVLVGQVLSQIPEFAMEFGPLQDWLPQLPSDGISATTPATDGPHGLDIELGQATKGRPLNNADARRLLDQYPALRDFELWLGHDGELVLGQDTTRVKVKVPSLADLKFNRSGTASCRREPPAIAGKSSSSRPWGRAPKRSIH